MHMSSFHVIVEVSQLHSCPETIVVTSLGHYCACMLFSPTIFWGLVMYVTKHFDTARFFSSLT